MSARIPSAAARRRLVPIFFALGDDIRLAIIAKLSEGRQHSIAELTERTRVSRQAVTKHLRVLERARIVRSVHQGRETLFELDPEPIHEVKHYAAIVVERYALGPGSRTSTSR